MHVFLTSPIGTCGQDSNCVPASCCHADSCVFENESPDCEAITCTQECIPGTLDCGQGHCRCIEGDCKVVME